MNNEFNNNQPNEYMGNNDFPNSNNVEQDLNQNLDQNLNQNVEQNLNQNITQNNDQGFDNSYSIGNFATDDNISQADTKTANNDPYMVYPTPQVVEEENKPKKKKKGFKVFKLTAAALAFGLISGAAFQGYYVIANGTGNSVDTSGEVKVAQVSQDTSGDTIVPETTSTGDSVVTDVSGVVDSVMPSIVAINSTITATNYDAFGRAYSEQGEGSGSGIIIGQNDSELLIVTNNHVIDGATSVEVVFADESTTSAQIKGSDANADLAILSVNMKDLTEDTIAAIKVATLGDSTQVKAGDMAIAIGNALGYGQSVTVGYISAVNREVTIDDNTMTLLQTDAAINPGNSGGALLNTSGQVIGINSVKYASEEVEGMGYSIPISSALPMINELMNRETISTEEQGYLGIDAATAQNVTSDYSERFNMPVGVYVNDVISDSPAEAAGLEQGDIITGIDDVTVETIDDLINVLGYKKAGQKVELKIQTKQSGEYKETILNITLGNKN